MPPRKKKIAEEEVSVSLPPMPAIDIPEVESDEVEIDTSELEAALLLAALSEIQIEEEEPEPSPEPEPAKVEPTPEPEPVEAEEEPSYEELVKEARAYPPVTVLPKDQSSIASSPAALSEALTRRLSVAKDALELFCKEKLQTQVVVVGPFVAVDKTKTEKMVARLILISTRSYSFIDVIDDTPRAVCKSLIRAAVQ